MIYIVWMRNGWGGSEWILQSTYQLKESAEKSLDELVERFYPKERGYELKITNVVVKP